MRKIKKQQDKPKVKKTDGVLIGYNYKKPIMIEDNAKHVFVCGTTGSGKTVVLSNFIKRAVEQDFPLLIVDGKGDLGQGSLLEITQAFCEQSDKKLYVVNLSDVEQSAKYNPFQNASSTACKDMLINLTEWSEEHYKLNTERYLQKVISLMRLSDIPLSLHSIVKHISIDNFQVLSKKLVDSGKQTKEEHLYNMNVIKGSGDIVQGAFARFSLLLESDIGNIFEDNGIDIYTVIKENAVILFVLNPLIYPETSKLMGRLILIDSKQAISKCFNSSLNRAFFIFDEINSYSSPVLIDLVNKSRSANITSILATQSLSDLDYAVDENFKEQVIENCNNYIVLRQNSAKNSENWANIIGTQNTANVTYQIDEGSTTGKSSLRFTKEYIFHPDDIKNLKLGEGFFICKDNGMKIKISTNKPF